MTAQTPTPHPRDKCIPLYFVAFFAVFMLVDALFVTIAVKTNSGVVTEHAYENGINYNDTLERAAEQKALGWDGELRYDEGTDTLLFTLKDDKNQPLSGAEVQARLIQPGDKDADTTLPLSQTEPGRYMTSLDGLQGGQWQVRIFATWQQHHYQLGRTTILLPHR